MTEKRKQESATSSTSSLSSTNQTPRTPTKQCPRRNRPKTAADIKRHQVWRNKREKKEAQARGVIRRRNGEKRREAAQAKASAKAAKLAALPARKIRTPRFPRKCQVV
jgi:hypothetical protein